MHTSLNDVGIYYLILIQGKTKMDISNDEKTTRRKQQQYMFILCRTTLPIKWNRTQEKKYLYVSGLEKNPFFFFFFFGGGYCFFLKFYFIILILILRRK